MCRSPLMISNQPKNSVTVTPVIAGANSAMTPVSIMRTLSAMDQFAVVRTSSLNVVVGAMSLLLRRRRRGVLLPEVLECLLDLHERRVEPGLRVLQPFDRGDLRLRALRLRDRVEPIDLLVDLVNLCRDPIFVSSHLSFSFACAHMRS